MTDQPKWTPGPWAMETVRTSCGTCHRIGPFPRPAYASKPEGWACVYDDYPPGVGSPDLLANSHLIAAAPDLYFGGEAQTDIIRHAQAILTQYLIPDGIDGPEAINQLLGLLDGPEQRAAQAAWDAALAKARGETK